ncbi:Centromere/kinetochore protein zw10 [Pseudolycoriella hygida]|uniref:Centromere/kinetochore protein zw10 n=1 Tax=Pseudolycoriella hygida TaxID=35572 RepID=A0A9Q0MY99_9DIPT|nr:Centromere/kinetochore protein zw10 [Pseudolycoriella hygida]
MSFLGEVLNIVNENESISLKKNTTNLVEEIANLQNKVKTYVEDNFENFLPNAATNRQYLDEADRIVRDIDNLYHNLSNESKVVVLGSLDKSELGEYIQNLDEAKAGLHTSHKILKIDHLFQCIEVAKTHKEYQKFMGYIFDIKDLINDPKDEIFRQLDCFANINIRYQIENQSLLYSLKQEFDQLVQLKEKSFEKTKCVTMRVSKNREKFAEIALPLINTKFNSRTMCEFLLNNVFKPIITKPVSIEMNDADSSFVQMQLSYSTIDLSDDLRPNYKNVFENLKLTIECLQLINNSFDEKVCVFTIIANSVKEQFIDLLRNSCLSYSIPNTINEMKVSTMVDDIKEFNEFLVSTKFLRDNDTELTNFAQKIDVLFQNRFCRNILESAVEIMRKDLHDMMIISDNGGGSASMFPRCMISKSTSELVTLMDKVLHQSKTATEDIVEKLLSTIPSILERYITEVPTHHAKLLVNIPQQAALFHNNCNYLAYWTAKNGDKIELVGNIVQSLQKLGADHFVRQINNQKEQIMELLREFNPLTIETDVMSQKIIRQCLRQFDLLKNVWQTILPDEVYTSSMATLLNEFCVEIIRRICALEDIPSTVSNGLVDILDIIIERAPTIFEENQQIMIAVPKWVKLTQLKMILNASLVQITEQWSEGKGPLTLNYKAEEVKSLIRALFQNTDRRANALFLIK